MREDWVEIELGEVCNFIGGGTPSKANPNFWNGILPWASIKDMKGDYLFETQDYITELGLKSSSTNLALPNEIILATRITPGKPIISTIKTTINQDLKVVKPKIKIDSKFLFYIFKSYEKDIVKLSSGTTVLGVNLNSLNTIIIPLAPLPIQRAIVQKIESYFELLDKGIADLKTAQEQLKIYRQAVLKKAFEGDWMKTTVGDLFDFIGGGTPSKKEKDYWNGEIPWASVKDIKGDYLTSTQDYITDKGLNNSSANLAIKDEVILITRISPGKAIITKIDTAINQDLKIAKPKIEMFNQYVLFLFKSIERECVKLSSGTTVLGINLQNLKSIQIPKIDIDEQHTIVREIESRLSVCDKVEQSISESLEKAEALRQSILKKAFEGKLLSGEEIAQCKQEADYEPTSVLLERIRKENKHGK